MFFKDTAKKKKVGWFQKMEGREVDEKWKTNQIQK